MKTTCRNYIAQLGMATAFILSASPLLTRVNAAQLLTPSIS